MENRIEPGVLVDCERASQWMERAAVDALVACSAENVYYFTGYRLWIDNLFRRYMVNPGASTAIMNNFAVLSATGDAALVLPQPCELEAADLWVHQRFVFGVEPSAASEDLENRRLSDINGFTPSSQRSRLQIDALVSALRENHLASARLGVEMEVLPAEDRQLIVDALPEAEVRDCSQLLRLIRMVKSADEQKLMRRAAKIAETGAMEAVKLAGPGKNLQDLVQCFREYVASQGADFDHFAFAPGGVGMTASSCYQLGDQETMFVDFGCLLEHYFSDSGFTLMVGEVGSEDLQRYELVLACLMRAAESLRPDTRASEVKAVMDATLEEGGVVGENPHGHGLGLEVRDYPILTPDNGLRIRDQCIDVASDVPLEEGMILCLEVPVFSIPDRSFQLEQMFLVTSDGGQPLTERDLTQPMFG